MFDYKQLVAFATVIEHQSFDAAAKALHLTQPAISQRIRQLEERLKQPLLIRSTPCRPTQAGERLLQHFEQVRLLESQLNQDLSSTSGKDRPKVSLATNADSLATWLLPALAPLIKSHDLIVDFHTDDQDKTLDFMRQGTAHGAISSTEKPLQGARSEALGFMPYYLVASPSFVERYFANGVNANTLKKAPTVIYGRDDELTNQFLTRYFGISDDDTDCFTVPSAEAFATIALTGTAYVTLPQLQAQPWLDTGKLINIAPGKSIDVPLWWHHWDIQNDVIKALTSCLIEEAGKVLAEVSGN